MPEVPVYRRQVESRPLHVARQNPGASPSAGAASLGAGLSHAANVLNAVREKEQLEADNTALLEADNALDAWESSALNDAENGAYTRKGKDAFDLPGQVLPQFDAETKRIEQSLGSERARQHFRAVASRRRQQIDTGLNRHEFTEREQFKHDQETAKLASSAQMIGANYSDPARVEQELTKQVSVLAERANRLGWSEEQREQALAKVRADAHISVINAAAAAGNYVYAEEYFEARAGEIDAARTPAVREIVRGGKIISRANSILSAYRGDAKKGVEALTALESSDLTDEEKNDIRSKVREGIGLIVSERRQQYSDQVTHLERAIAKGAPDANAEGQAAYLYRRGAYSAAEYTNVLERIDNARQAGAKQNAVLSSVQEALRLGQRLDPKNEKVVDAVDTLFQAAAQEAGLERGSDAWVNAAADLARRTNILPPEVMSWARSQMLSEEPALVAPAATAIARWADEAPVAYSYFDDPNLKAYAENVNALLSVGADPAKAIETVRKTMEIPKARQDELAQQYRSEKYAKDNGDELQSFLDSDDAFDRAIFGGAPAPSQTMVNDFEAAVRLYYSKTNGDIGRARELAWKDIRGVYGYSTVNGQPEVLKYAPELIYPGIDVSVIRSDMMEAAKASGFDPATVRMIPSHRTGTTRGLLWHLAVEDADGNVDLVLGPDNRPVDYAIPTDTERYVEAQETAKRKAVEAARDKARRARAMADSMAELGAFPGY